MDYSMYDCAACNDRMKRANGCTGQPLSSSGEPVQHVFPEDESLWTAGEPEVTLDTCPANLLADHADVQEVFRAANLSTVAPVARQSELPWPYLEGLSVVLYHREAASAWRAKKRAAERKAKRRGR